MSRGQSDGWATLPAALGSLIAGLFERRGFDELDEAGFDR
jgi:hypothetical protein